MPKQESQDLGKELPAALRQMQQLVRVSTEDLTMKRETFEEEEGEEERGAGREGGGTALGFAELLDVPPLR